MDRLARLQEILHSALVQAALFRDVERRLIHIYLDQHNDSVETLVAGGQDTTEMRLACRSTIKKSTLFRVKRMLICISREVFWTLKASLQFARRQWKIVAISVAVAAVSGYCQYSDSRSALHGQCQRSHR